MGQSNSLLIFWRSWYLRHLNENRSQGLWKVAMPSIAYIMRSFSRYRAKKWYHIKTICVVFEIWYCQLQHNVRIDLLQLKFVSNQNILCFVHYFLDFDIFYINSDYSIFTWYISLKYMISLLQGIYSYIYKFYRKIYIIRALAVTPRVV